MEGSENLSLDNIIGKINKGVLTRKSMNLFYEHITFVSQLKPTSVLEVLNDADWIYAVQDELNLFT